MHLLQVIVNYKLVVFTEKYTANANNPLVIVVYKHSSRLHNTCAMIYAKSVKMNRA